MVVFGAQGLAPLRNKLLLSQTQERKLPSAEEMDPASASAHPLQTWFLITQAGHELAMKQGTASNSQSSCLNLLDAKCPHLFY